MVPRPWLWGVAFQNYWWAEEKWIQFVLLRRVCVWNILGYVIRDYNMGNFVLGCFDYFPEYFKMTN